MKRDILFAILITLPLISGCTEAQLLTPTQTSMSSLTATIEPTTTIAPTPEPAYDLCPNIEDFRDCYVSEEELLDGTYWHWLNEVVAPTLLEDFEAREDQIRYDVAMRVAGLSSGGIFVYPSGGRAYENEETTAPWNRKVTFATIATNDNDRASEYMILPVFYYDKEKQQVFPVITIQPIWNAWGDKKMEKIETVMDVYINTMKTPIIKFSSTTAGNFEQEVISMSVPLVGKFYERLGQEEAWKRTEKFYNGDYSAFSSPDMIVAAVVAEGMQ